MHTHFHTLGIAPGTDRIETAKSYRDQVVALLQDEFPAYSGMKHGQSAQTIKELTEAFIVLFHWDRRELYLRELRKACMLCSLCDGRGFILVDQISQIPCAACGHTGWAFQIKDTPRRVTK